MANIDGKQVKKEFDSTHNPLYFFDDDPDGLCSFLQVYKHIKDGKGIIIKKTPRITEEFVKNVVEYCPDKIFVLDIAMVDQEFIDKAKVPIVWIDHHSPMERHNIKYHNPRTKDKENNLPTSLVCYNILKKNLWLAMAGSVADWYLPEKLAKEFSKKYPDLLPKSIKKPEDALFNTKLGKLIKILSFNLKGKRQNVVKSIKIFTRIDDPYEILKGETPRAKLILMRYEKINRRYKELFDMFLDVKPDGEFLILIYDDNRLSLTKDFSNEILYKNPDKVVIVGRTRNGEVKLSLRSRKYNLPPILEKALKSVNGYGGGHEHACGAVVKEEDFKAFIENLKREIG